MPVPVHEAGKHRAPVEIERGLGRGWVHLGPAAAKDNASVLDE
jgi:hypothetical protein